MAARGSYFEMPGLFTPPPPGRSGSRTDLFAPIPRLAAATETFGQVTDSGVLPTRKRSRHNDGSFSTVHATDTWADSSLAISRHSNAKSPPPLANDRYELAGGMEGSETRFGRHNGDYDDYYQLQKQRGMWATPTATPFGRQQHQPTTDDIVMQPTPDSATAKPWMINQLMSLVGGVAGKLIHFCSVPFRGFQAGGGQAFDAQGDIAARLGLQDDDFNSTTGAIQRPQIGNYPEDDYGVLSIESVDQELERPRMTKRLRTGESWVVVDKEGEMESRPSTPRLSERKHARSSSIPRPVSRAGTTATPKRPSLIPISRRSTLDRKSFQGASKPAVLTSPRSYTRQSYGSPVMFENKTKQSPLPPDSQRLINKLKREEMEEDARLRRMSSQMSNLLREAREALGSKADFYDEMDTSTLDDGHTERGWYQR